jgi:hypothetical protein
MKPEQIKTATDALEAFVRSPLAYASPSREHVQTVLDALGIFSREVVRLTFAINVRAPLTLEEMKAAEDGARMVETGDPLSPEERAAMEGTKAPDNSLPLDFSPVVEFPTQNPEKPESD